MAEEEEKKLTPEQLKMKELLGKFDVLMKEFLKEGYRIAPFNQLGIRLEKMQKPESPIIPYNPNEFNPLKR